jgi:hypothetical protein
VEPLERRQPGRMRSGKDEIKVKLRKEIGRMEVSGNPTAGYSVRNAISWFSYYSDYSLHSVLVTQLLATYEPVAMGWEYTV